MASGFGQISIGGYFGLEIPFGCGELYPNAQRFQSARAAFLALLWAGKPDVVWMPWYICDSMIEPLRMSGTKIARYSINSALEIHDELKLGDNEWLLYVNYFGIGSIAVEKILRIFPKKQVIIDHAQALYAKPQQCLATIYSPRKFFGVPDGGYLFTSLAVLDPTFEDSDSFRRTKHLIKRTAFGAEAGYYDFVAAEESLIEQVPKRMSSLTQRMLQAIDYSVARKRRQENCRYLHAMLGDLNELPVNLDNDTVPLCYPFFFPRGYLRERLIESRIYVPTYWLDFDSKQIHLPEFEKSLRQNLLPLPCDQRYTIQEMEMIVKIIRNSI